MATYNRAATLRETIRHLAGQELSPNSYEVIIIDDCSPDETQEVVERATREVPFALRYLRHSPNRGPGYTQNRGLEAATAPLILLMADDILMSPQALKAHVAMHETHPEPTSAALGRVVQSPQLNQSVFLKTWDPFRFSSFEGLSELPYYRFWACNISVKKELALRCRGFREHRGRGGAPAHEDPELGYRLHLAGLRIFYAHEALGYHYHVVSFENACKRKYEAGLNFGEFLANVPEPEITVAYHVLNSRTVRDHLRAWLGPRRQYLSAGDRKPLAVIARHFCRMAAFNGLTVTRLWEPIARRAEAGGWFRSVVNREMYRGILFYYFLKGCRDGDRKFGRGGQLVQSP